MPLLYAENVTKYYGADLVLERVSLTVDERDRIGLIGANGTGKTTLCRMVLGQLQPDDGQISLVGGTTVGYLSQDPDFPEGQTLWDAAMACFPELREMEDQLASLEERMADPGGADLDELVERHETVRSEFEREGGYDYERRTRIVLTGLGFRDDDFHRPIDEFSGGEKNRAALATLLLTDPDLLLLDEPTNHLDIQGTEWLEGHLQTYRGAVIAISHDRRFLNATARRIIEVSGHELVEYTGNYDDYNQQKETRLLTYQREFTKQQREKDRQLEFIRWALGTQQEKRVRAAKSRMKLLDKVEWLDPPEGQRRKMTLRFTPRIRGGDEIIDLVDVAAGYDDPIVSGVNLQMRRGDRVGIVGPNGCGKTTLLKAILGELEPMSGQMRVGRSMEVGYYAQARMALTPANTVMEEFAEVVKDASIGELRNLLARFLFIEEDVFKRVGQLSGGEQSRLTLAKLIMTRPSFLVLDEPTNHLDIDSRGALENALGLYTGTLLVVSHDRYFLDAVVNRIVAIDGETSREFEGNYTAYREALRREDELKEQSKAAQRAEERQQRLEVEKQARNKRKAKRAAEESSSEYKLRIRAAELEKQSAELEARLAELEQLLANPELYDEPSRVQELNIEHHRVQGTLKETYAAWESAVDQLGDDG
ncbi:MAG TPA: ATP-binding cassette domain-containing protein [Armatimonadota bacterium]|nr:ATP-binding cassette domain-containing protein [Armatimonadota bacterium]